MYFDNIYVMDLNTIYYKCSDIVSYTQVRLNNVCHMYFDATCIRWSRIKTAWVHYKQLLKRAKQSV